MDYKKASVSVREETGGQIETGLKTSLDTQDDLATFYSPGIAGPCMVIADDVEQSKKLTIRKNTVAVVSDGSAVLGLGNIGPEAALPVMEGKSMLLKHFGGVDGFPIVLNTQDTEEIIETVKRIAPTFGGINLEDIAAPRCFEIEQRLTEALDIPVFHDDQHGTAICTLAALINALKLTKKSKDDIRVVISGAGAAGIATAKLLRSWGVEDLDLVDSRGVIDCRREGLNGEKKEFCSFKEGNLASVLVDADVFIGVSKANILTPEMVKSMKVNPIVFAMANPDPEIHPDLAEEAGIAVMATGRSDYPNQINNVLVFPGLFRGLLDAGINRVTEEMKLEAAMALASIVETPRSDYIIPHPFDEAVPKVIAQAIKGVSAT